MDPTLQDNALIPYEFAEYINHIGNVTGMHSITNSGLIPSERRLRKERQWMFFTAVNPMDELDFQKTHDTTWTKARIAVYKNQLESSNYSFLVQPETCSQGIVLFDTQPAICIETVVHRKN